MTTKQRTPEQKKKIYESLLEEGYSIKEAKGVLQGLDDIENDRTFSAEEVYKELLIDEKTYA